MEDIVDTILIKISSTLILSGINGLGG
jgi:hypothetical protein